jgi:hypothetical protein
MRTAVALIYTTVAETPLAFIANVTFPITLIGELGAFRAESPEFPDSAVPSSRLIY